MGPFSPNMDKVENLVRKTARQLWDAIVGEFKIL